MSRRLVVFAPNWLGDAVMALPAIQAVREAHPGARLDVAARASVAPVFSLSPLVDGVLILERSAADLAALREGAYDTAILLPNSFNSALLAWRAGIAERWGYRGDGRSWLLTKAVSIPLRLHQVDYYRRLVAECGCPSTNDTPRLVATEQARSEAAALLRSSGWNGEERLLAMAPGAAYGTAKRWPVGSFAALTDRLSSEGIRVVLIGSGGDRAAALAVAAASRASQPPLDLVGRTDLVTLAGVLVQCGRLVTNDSGAMHLAAALGVSVTAMFGPTRERETSPRGTGHQHCLIHDVWCRPCMLRECPLVHRCMTGISVEAVYSASRASAPELRA